VTRDPAPSRAAAVLGLLFATMGLLACGRGLVQPTREDQTTQHEPQGMVPLNDQPWNGVSTNGWGYLRRTSAKDDDIASDATAPVSPPQVLRIVFTPSMQRDSEPSVHWIVLPRSREVFTTWWMKLSPNWTPSPAGAAKMTFLQAWPDGQGQVYAALLDSRAPHRMAVNTEWAPYGQKVWESNVTTSRISYDRWYGFAWYAKWESAPGAGDGILRWWVDGVLNGDHTNVIFPSGSGGFQQFEFAPTVQVPAPAEQYMYIDHTHVSAR